MISKEQVRCGAKILKGFLIAEKIKQRIKMEVPLFIQIKKRPPCLSIILVGDHIPSMTYVIKKMEAAKDIGITTDLIKKPSDVTKSELITIINDLNNNSKVDGILIQLPLPLGLSTDVICNALSPIKDVDGLSAVNFGLFCQNLPCFYSCAASAIVEIVKHFVVCGRSTYVGLPIAVLISNYMFKHFGATTTICHEKTPLDQLVNFTKQADIIVSATGIPHLINGSMVKEGSCVIDVGFNRICDPYSQKETLVGDVDFNDVINKVAFISPVPGGIGPITVAKLLENTLVSAWRQTYINIK